MILEIYFTKEIKQAINDLIDEGYRSYNAIPEPDKEKLAVYCMNALKDDAYVFVTNTKRIDKLACQLKSFLLNGSIDDAIDMATTLCEAAVEKSEEVLPDIFDEIYSERIREQKIDAGYRQCTDQQTGEKMWVK